MVLSLQEGKVPEQTQKLKAFFSSLRHHFHLSYSQSPLDPAISEAVFLKLKLSLNSTKYVVGYLEKKQALLVIRVCFRLIIPQTHFFTPCVCGLNCTKSNCKSSGRMTVTFYCWTSQEGSLAIHGNSHCVAISSVVTNA